MPRWAVVCSLNAAKGRHPIRGPGRAGSAAAASATCQQRNARSVADLLWHRCAFGVAAATNMQPRLCNSRNSAGMFSKLQIACFTLLLSTNENRCGFFVSSCCKQLISGNVVVGLVVLLFYVNTVGWIVMKLFTYFIFTVTIRTAC